MDNPPESPTTDPGQILPAKKEGFYVKTHGGRIHSRYNPRREAHRRLPDSIDQHGRFVVLGAGLGYILDELSKNTRHPEVLLLEPNPIWLRKGRERGIWSSKQLENLKIITQIDTNSFEKIGSFFRLGEHHQFHLIPWDDYQNREAQFFQKSLKKIKKIQHLQDESIAVLHNQGPDWVQNTRINLPHLPQSQKPNLQDYDGDVALVSAGPSLDQQKAWLRKNHDALLIIVGNTAGPIFERSPEIDPDIHLAVDTNPPVADDLNACSVNHLWLSPFVPPQIPRETRRNLTFLGVETPVTQWLADADFLPRVQPGGSITSTLIRYLNREQNHSLYLLGCDMQIRHGRYYARGTDREQRYLKKLSRFHTLPEWHLLIKNRENDSKPLENEREWFTEQTLENERIFIPNNPPSWWQGRVDPSSPRASSKPFRHDSADQKSVRRWLATQSEFFHAHRAGRNQHSGWTSFFQWVEEIFEHPEEELQAWEDQFAEICQGL